MRAPALFAVTLSLAASPVAAAFHALEAEPRGMFALYEENRRSGIPNYITEDFLLLSYSMLLDQALAQVEESRFGPAFSRLIDLLRSALREQPDGAVRRANEDFLAVIEALLATDAVLPAEDPVREEWSRVLAAQGIARSELMGQRLDYSQFQVRGRYAGSPELERYFRAVRYAGTVFFPVLPSQATGVTPQEADRLTAQALQLTSLMAGQDEISRTWEDLGGQLEWWFGPADDLGGADYRDLGHGNTELDLATLRHRLLERARDTGRQPRILGGLVDLDRLEEGLTANDVLTGWRLFPQSYTPDSAAFQQLVHNRVGRYLGQGRPRTLSVAGGHLVKGLPSALELVALLGSRHAVRQLDATDERNYEGYAEAAEEAGKLLAGARGLTGENFAVMRLWLEDDPESERRVTSVLAFWTYHRYVNLLYAKPSYTGVSKGFRLPPKRRTAWLEPAPELYARLARNARALGERADCFACDAFADVMERCVQVAVRERAGLGLDDHDVAFLNDLDFEIFKLTGRRDEPIVVDVHTDATSGLVIQEGIGWPEVVEKELDESQVSRGALFRHYELKQSLEKRLTDASWAQLLEDGELSPLSRAPPAPLPEGEGTRNPEE